MLGRQVWIAPGCVWLGPCEQARSMLEQLCPRPVWSGCNIAAVLTGELCIDSAVRQDVLVPAFSHRPCSTTHSSGCVSAYPRGMLHQHP